MSQYRRPSEERVREIVAIDKLWRNPHARLDFEEEMGLDPIVTAGEPGWNEQCLEGRTGEYQDKFLAWARNRVEGR